MKKVNLIKVMMLAGILPLSAAITNTVTIKNDLECKKGAILEIK